MISRVTLHNKLKPQVIKFRALGNVTRLSILYILAREPMEFHRLAHRLKLPPSLLSHHMKELHTGGWVTKMKIGKSVTYYVAEQGLISAQGFFQSLQKAMNTINSSN